MIFTVIGLLLGISACILAFLHADPYQNAYLNPVTWFVLSGIVFCIPAFMEFDKRRGSKHLKIVLIAAQAAILLAMLLSLIIDWITASDPAFPKSQSPGTSVLFPALIIILTFNMVRTIAKKTGKQSRRSK